MPVNTLLPRSSFKYRIQRYLDCLACKDDAELMALLLTVESKRYSPLRIFSQNFQERMLSIDPFQRYRDVALEYEGGQLVDVMLLTICQYRQIFS